MKNKSTKIIIGVMAAVLVIAGIAAYAVLHTPKMQFERGMTKLVQELASYTDPIEEQLNFSLLQENMRSTPHTVSTDMTITLPQQEDLDNFNLSFEAGIDYANRQITADFGAGAYMITVVGGELVVDDNTLYVSLPELLTDTYALQLDTLGSDYQDSAWKDLLGWNLGEETSLDLFADRTQTDETFTEALEAAAAALGEEITITKAPQKHDDNSGVVVKMPVDAVNTFLDSMQQAIQNSDVYQQEMDRLLQQSDVLDVQGTKKYLDDILGVRCKDDIEVNLYFDRSHCLRYLTTSSQIALQDSDVTDITFTADLTGEDRALDKIAAEIVMETTDGTTVELNYTRNASVTDTEYAEDMLFELIDLDKTTAMTLAYENTLDKDDLSFDGGVTLDIFDEVIALSAKGSYSDVVEGESFTLDLTTASLEFNGEALLRVAADISVAEGMEEVSVPAQATDLLNMDETAIQELIYELLYGTIAKYM